MCDMPEPCTFLSPDNCQKRFLWTHKKVDLALHTVVGLVLQVGDAEKFPRALGFESLDPFSESASRVHVSQPLSRMKVTRDLSISNLLVKLMVLHCQILLRLLHCQILFRLVMIAEEIVMQISAEQVPSLH